MASFLERDSGWVQAKVRRKGWPVQSKSFRTKTEAEAWARAVETEMDRGSFVSASLALRTTFSEIVERFKAEFAPFHYRERTDKKEAWRSQCKHLADFFGEYSMAALTPQLVAKYRDKRLKTDGEAKAASPSTVRKELNMLSKILTVAGQEFGVAVPTGNPVLNVRKPQEGKSRERRLSADEFAALLNECGKSRNPWLAPAVNFAVATAMRQGEILALRWEHVDKKRRLAMLHITKNDEPRAAPLTSDAIAVLDALPRSIAGVIFPVERLTLYHAFVAAAKRAGIRDFTFHDLRHEALTRLAERGDLSVIELASISGHKTLQMLKRYTHLRAEDLAKKLG